MIYRLSTEDRNQLEILRLISSHGFDSATLLQGHGLWKGDLEKTLVIEIDSPEDIHTESRIRSLAMAIRIANKQEAVLVQKISATSSLSTAQAHADFQESYK